MPGLPHYTNSKASSKHYEPFYNNLFEVTILPPSTVSGGSILLEHVNKIGGLTQDRGSEAITQAYKFAKRSYASGVAETINDLKVEFSLNLNDANELTYTKLYVIGRDLYTTHLPVNKVLKKTILER